MPDPSNADSADITSANKGNAAEELRDQVIELQTRLAFQEDTLQQLNQVIAEQDSDMRALQVQFQALLKRLDDLSYAFEQRQINPVDERPPHY